MLFRSKIASSPNFGRAGLNRELTSILAFRYKELKYSDPESYKIPLLALLYGLRVSESESMLWDGVPLHFDHSMLTPQDLEYYLAFLRRSKK